MVGQPTLNRFVILSLLLHLLLVVLFGNTTGTSSSPGDGWSTTLGVRLRPSSNDSTAEPVATPALEPGAQTNSLASALLRTLMEAAQLPPAGKKTSNKKNDSSPATPGPVEPVPQTQAPARPARNAAPAAQAPPVDPLPAMNRNAPEVADKPLKPAATTPAPIERPTAPPVELPVREVPVLAPAPIEQVEPPRIERAITPAAEVPQPPAPVAPAPIERVAPPKVVPVTAPVAPPAPREVQVAPPMPVEKVAPPAVEQAIKPPVERVVHEAPAATVPSTKSVAPAAPTSPATSAREGMPRTDSVTRPRLGAPEGRDDMFKPRTESTGPAPEPGAAPRLNFDTVRQRAREAATEGSGSRGLLPLQIPIPAERKSKLAEELEKAIKPDCRNAYAGMGLLAIPALVAGAVADVGCRW